MQLRNQQQIVFYFFVLIVTIGFESISTKNIEQNSFCLDTNVNLLKLKCPTNSVTRVIRAFYGYSLTGECHFQTNDCTVDVPHEDLSCEGEGCSVKVIDSPIILQDCWNQAATFIQVDFECIPVNQIHDMCSKTENEFNIGYIATPEYPVHLGSGLSCPCFLQANFNILIEFLDFRMPKCDKGGLTIWSKKVNTHCSTMPNGILPGQSAQNISMRLFSHISRKNSGFLLRYYTNNMNNSKVRLICYGNSSIKNLTKLGTAPKEDILILAKKSTPKMRAFEFDENLINKETTTQNLKTTSTSSIGVEKSVSKKNERSKDWSIIIVSIVVTVIFLLILINALIWFIFSMKEAEQKSVQYSFPLSHENNELMHFNGYSHQNIPINETVFRNGSRSNFY